MHLLVEYIVDSLLFWELKVWGLTLGLCSASSELSRTGQNWAGLGRTGFQAYLACPWVLAKPHAHSCDRGQWPCLSRSLSAAVWLTLAAVTLVQASPVPCLCITDP